MHAALWKRIAFTLAALLVVRVGVHIPLPGVNPDIWTQAFRQHAGGLLGASPVGRIGIFALSITPYILAAVLVKLLTMVSPFLRMIAEPGDAGRRRIELFTRCGAVLLAVLQAYGIAIALEGLADAVTYPPLVFRLSTVLTLTAGTLFLVWLADRITARGIGNGIALILLVGVVAEVPRDIGRLLEASRTGLLSQDALMALALMAAAATLAVVAVERARRRIPIEFATRAGPQPADLAVKLNPAGVPPALFAGWLITIGVFAAEIVGLLIAGRNWASGLVQVFGFGDLRHLAVMAVLIFFLTLVYAANVCDPERMAERLRRYGGSVAGVAPGEPTAAHLDGIISPIALLGAIYVTLVMLLPELLSRWFAAPIRFGGISLFVAVCVTLDLQAQVRALLAQSR